MSLFFSYKETFKKHSLSLIIFFTTFVLSLIVFLDNRFSGFEVGGMYQYIMSFRNSWRAGILFPRWDELMDCGVTLWHQRFPLAYLLPSLLFFLEPIASLKAVTLFFWVFSGFTMYLWVYSHIKDKPISIIGGLIYVFLPLRLQYTLLWGAFLPEMHFFIFPLFLLSFERKDESRKHVILATIMFALIVSSILQFAYFAAIFIGLYMCYEVLLNIRNSSYKNIFRLSSASLTILLLGLGLTAYFWLPPIFSEPFKRGSSVDLAGALIESEQNPIVNVVTLKFTKSFMEFSEDLRIFSKVYWFDFILPILAAISVLFYLRGYCKTKGQNIYFYYFIVVISIVVGLGNPVIWKFLRDYIPFFSSMRYPPRIGTFFPAIFYPLFIAYTVTGILGLLDLHKRKINLKIVCIAIFSLIVALPSSVNFVIATSNPLVFDKYQPKIPIHKLNKDGRIAMHNTQATGPWDLNNIEMEIVYSPYLWLNNRKTLFGIETTAIHKNLLGIIPHEPNERVVVMGMMNTRYLMTMFPIQEKDMMYLELVEPKSDIADLYIYEIKRYLPDVLLTRVVDYPFQGVREWAVKWVYNTPFDRISFFERPINDLIYKRWNNPLTQRLYERFVKKPLGIFGLYKEGPVLESGDPYRDIEFLNYNFNGDNLKNIKPIDGRYEVLKRTPEMIRLEIDLNEKAMLVFSQTHFPGWKATIDNEPTNIYTVNGMFIGIYLPAGRHVLEIWYGYVWYEIVSFIIMSLSIVILVLYGATSIRKDEAAIEKGHYKERGYQ